MDFSALGFVLVFVGSYPVTAYRSVPSQTDNSPYLTSIGQRTNEHGIAVSQNMLKEGSLKYGDLVYVGGGIGFKFVNDCMNERHHDRLDVWVKGLKEEKLFDEKFKSKKVGVWRVLGGGEKNTTPLIGKMVENHLAEGLLLIGVGLAVLALLANQLKRILTCCRKARCRNCLTSKFWRWKRFMRR